MRETRKGAGMKRAGDVLRELLKEQGWQTDDPCGPLFRCWEEMAGPQLAAHSCLVEVENGVLLVEVDHPGWLQMLHLRKGAILAAARAAAPKAGVEDVRGRIGRAGAKGGRQGPGQDPGRMAEPG